MSVRALYQATLAERGYTADEAQLRAVAALERCEREWADYKARRRNAITKLLVRPPIPRGVYMHGGVGRGKSFLMDCFFQAVPLQRKTRLHFHEFMREVHRELQDLKGTVNPLDELGRRIARRFRLICFDEFHVADVTDAMILHRLLVALFANRVSIVTTSNFHPDALYPNGLHRDRILPAIELLKQHLEVVNVDAGIDYRQRTLQQVEMYHCPLGDVAEAALERAFGQLAEARDEDPRLNIEHRELRALRRAGGVVWFDFKQLCGGPRSQNDYLEIASRFHTVLLSGVPQMSPWSVLDALADAGHRHRIKAGGGLLRIGARSGHQQCAAERYRADLEDIALQGFAVLALFAGSVHLLSPQASTE